MRLFAMIAVAGLLFCRVCLAADAVGDLGYRYKDQVVEPSTGEWFEGKELDNLEQLNVHQKSQIVPNRNENGDPGDGMDIFRMPSDLVVLLSLPTF